MIHLSQAATREIKRMQSKRQKAERLRIRVQLGGCEGLFYSIDFEDTVNESDRLYDCDGISVIIDEQSLTYLPELSLDYSEDLMGGAFRFHNPQALTSCGCGNSFSIAS